MPVQITCNEEEHMIVLKEALTSKKGKGKEDEEDK